ncbi:MAG TPA: TolC family outer membrane protein [Rubrivivax sp.]|nr:TolC family outer membrane protein [Rubrivivax sp.]
MRSSIHRPARRGPACLRALTAIALAIPALAFAQSLQELYTAARGYDATYLAARALSESAEFRSAQAEALNLPSANVTAGATAEIIDVPTIGTGDSNTVNAALNGRYALFNRANGSTIEQARKGYEAALADLELAEHDLIVRVAQAYFEVLFAQDSLSAANADKTAIAEQLASAKRNFEVGTATITDTREAQARFDLRSAQVIAAENELRNRRLALDQLVGRSGVTPKGLALPVPLPETVRADADQWVIEADAQHPFVRKARLGLDVATLETDKARAAELPTVDLVATLGSSQGNGSAVAIGGLTSRSAIGVQLNWPIYTGGATQNRIKETLSLEEKSRNDLEAVRRAVALNTRVTYNSVQSLLAQVTALEAAEESTKVALEATQLGYKVGVRVNLDVLNAQTLLFATQRDLAKARYDVLVGYLLLRQASGQLSLADIDRVNNLLLK